MQCPAMKGADKLCNKEGKIFRHSEKHIMLWCEILFRYVPRSAIVCDFCAGTLSTGIACLRVNQKHCILNDRDPDVVAAGTAQLVGTSTRTRLEKILVKELLSALMGRVCMVDNASV